MYRFVFPSIVLLILLMSSLAQAGVIRHDVNRSAYENLATQYASVGQIWSGDASTGLGSAGSGTLVSPHWVVTAAHVLNGQDHLFTLNAKTHSIKEAYIHPNWNGKLYDGHDLALVQLKEPIYHTQPAALNLTRSPIGETATFVGYGLTGDGVLGSVPETTQRLAGQNVLDQAGDDFFFLLDNSLVMSDFDYSYPLTLTSSTSGALGETNIPTMLGNSRYINRMGDDTPIDLEYLPASGDSGGGVFIDSEFGPELIGVISMNLAWDGHSNSSYTDMAGIARLDIARDWISTTIPEPSVFTSLYLAIYLLFTRNINLANQHNNFRAVVAKD